MTQEELVKDPYKNQVCKCGHIRGEHYYLREECANYGCKCQGFDACKEAVKKVVEK